MAATDKSYRNQHALDIVFALCSVLMLVSIVWMFMDDYNREYKVEQRRFRDVEAAVAQRQALDQLPSSRQFDDAATAVDEARADRNSKLLRKDIDELKDKLAKAQQDGSAADVRKLEESLVSAELRLKINEEYPVVKTKIAELLPKRERSEQAYQAVKADLDSISSFYDIEVDEHGPRTGKAESYYQRIQDLRERVKDAQASKDQIMSDLKEMQAKTDFYEAPLTEAISKLKKVTDRFDAQVKLAFTKQWGVGDFVRNLPVLDAFAPPLKIQQFTINDIPIDYNFKYVTRFDRCMTCHEGIDRPGFARSKLEDLTRSSDYDVKLEDAWDVMKRRRSALKGLPEAQTVAKWQDLQLTKIPKTELTRERITEFCAHPRLELFVGSNSKHPAEKFGCTSCHSGQGSATSFTLASHTPNTSTAKRRWTDKLGWESIHMWDFPMQPMRFVESGCLKCHHQVTDLVSSNNRNEAPKLLRGFNLIKENGCFACHEIAGRKAGRQIGPDLRLEPTPPLESLSPSERARIESDPDTAPGNLRKVGPSLYRLAEKTNKDWVAKWLRAPRGFRPDTKMPHFYGVSNNHHEALQGTGQETFPDTEISSIAHFLFQTSGNYLKELAERQKDDAAVRAKDEVALAALEGLGKLTDVQKKELDDIRRRVHMRQTPLLVDQAPGYKGDAAHGRILFSERGCLACHSHQATAAPQSKSGDKDYSPAIIGEANFGPNLSQIVEKLGAKKGDKESARTWLIQWVLDPHLHSPRSRMPVTHLTNTEAADVAAWLLSQPALDVGAEWADLTVLEPDDKELKALAKVYLVRLLSQTDMDGFLKDGKLRPEVTANLPVEERELAQNFETANGVNEEGLKHYLGKKAIGRLGCFACHDIPGFDNAKPIGVGLNDWGKKDPGRLAFEDIRSYLEDHYKVVDSLVDGEGKPVRPEMAEEHGHKIVKMPYEKFYADALVHNHRDGYLNQKILAPRSYDYNRLRAWDDRSRMPQFRFARSRKKDGETAAAFEARSNVDEAEAREAVATFILGLVADPVPTASISQPKGDRLAEVKGRQVLEKFNCGGCHLVRPGSFDFKLTPEVLDKLVKDAEIFKKQAAQGGEHFFSHHSDWVGKSLAPPDKIAALGARPRVAPIDEDDPSKGALARFRLTRAVRFQGDDRKIHDIESARELNVAPRDMLYPPPAAWESKETLAAFMKDKGPFGGAFADLLVDYLVDKDKGNPQRFYTRDIEGDPTSDSSKARAAVPPLLLGQGERVQPDWLYQFLLKPEPVRKMVVLRMPRFNMSQDEARTLVDYFAGVERMENTGIGLKYPYESIAQQDGFSGPFWVQKNKEYIARLKAGKGKDAQGKEISLFEKRHAELLPIWEQILKDRQTEESKAKSKLDIAKKRLDEAKKTLETEKDAAKKAPLAAALKAEEGIFQAWESEWNNRAGQAKVSAVDKQRQLWENEQAYVTDGYRLLANRQLCMLCHQLDATPNNNQIQGPPLYLSHQRLRPGWLEYWIANPQRFLTYGSSMPINFPAGKPAEYQDLFAGTSLEQIIAVRDVLMIYPRVAALPVSQHWALPSSEATKTAEKK